MADAHKNFAVSTVATAPSPASSGTSLTVASGDGALFPGAPFNATVWPASAQPTAANAEIVRVTAVSTDTFTITRAQEGTSARSIGIGDLIAATITAKTLTDAEPPTVVTSLPGSPSDGDECYLKVGSGDTAVIWHLKYDSAITDSYKWRFLGGGALEQTVDGTASGASCSTSYGDLATTLVSVTCGPAGVYSIGFRASAFLSIATAVPLWLTPKLGSATTSDTDGVRQWVNAANSVYTMARLIERTLTSASSVVKLQQKQGSSSGTASYENVSLRVTPVRVG